MSRRLEELLVKHGIVHAAAIDDPEGYDNYDTIQRIREAQIELDADTYTIAQIRAWEASLSVREAARWTDHIDSPTIGLAVHSERQRKEKKQ